MRTSISPWLTWIRTALPRKTAWAGEAGGVCVIRPGVTDSQRLAPGLKVEVSTPLSRPIVMAVPFWLVGISSSRMAKVFDEPASVDALAFETTALLPEAPEM